MSDETVKPRETIARIEAIVKNSQRRPMTHLRGALEGLRAVAGEASFLTIWIDEAEAWILKGHSRRTYCSCAVCKLHGVARIQPQRESKRGRKAGAA